MKRLIVLPVFLVLCNLLHADSAEPTLEKLRDRLEAATRMPSSDLGHARIPKEEVDTAVEAFETAQTILSKNISEEFRIWTLKRKALALITLAYEKTVQYLPELIAVVDELDGKKSCENIQAEAEKHVLLVGTLLVLKPMEDENGRKVSIDVKSLAERIVTYASAHPSPESQAILQLFFRTIDQPTPSRLARDKRLAAVVPLLGAYYAALPDKNSQSLASYLQSVQRRMELPGKPMLLTGLDLDGKLFDSAFVKDKVVLVQFWGTWCKPCLHEMPTLVELYDKYKKQGFEIVGVNTSIDGDERPLTVKKFLDLQTFGPQQRKITWPIIHEGLSAAKKLEPLSSHYGIKELPVLILIGRNGNVISVNPMPSSLEVLIQDALAGVSLDDLTKEERAKAEAARKKQDEELDRQIQRELDAIKKKNEK